MNKRCGEKMIVKRIISMAWEGISVAEYRRFISYMYLYEDGRKTINSGFVRVENRDDQCRILIHMSGIYNSENDVYRVYMLIRESGGYIGIAVGAVQIRQQTGEMEIIMDSAHLMGTAYDLSRVAGMVLLGENGNVYGTRWDDEPLETDKFVNREQLSEKLVRFGNTNADAAVGEKDDGADMKENAEQQDEQSADGYNLREILQREPVQHADENPLIPEEELALESNLENAAELRNMDKSNTEIEESSMALASDAEIEETESIHEKGKECPMNVYELLMSQLPQMYPFEDDSVEDCVRMELQDIGRMPMSCWVYGSNSFLLHGYYCYRHLILAKVERRKDKDGIDDMAEHEDIYLMGVPGIWQHREQYMASMFGFRKFKPVSHEKQRSGDFGYWCVELK